MQRIFEYLLELIGWIRIVASPFLIGVVIAAVVYLPDPNTTRLAIAISMMVLGLIIGIIWAVKVSKNGSTFTFISRILGTPDLKNEEDELEVHTKRDDDSKKGCR